MQLERTGDRRRRWLVLAPIAAIAVVAAACLPDPPPPPPPAPSTTTATTAAPTTTTMPACPSATSAAAAADSGEHSGEGHDGQTRYAAVVKRGARSKVFVRDVSSAADVAQFRADVERQGTVLAFAEDGEAHALDTSGASAATTPVGPPQQTTWGFDATGFASAWTVATASKGAGVTVAVLDTGVDANHPDLADHFVGAPATDFVTGTCLDGSGAILPTLPVTTDPNGHGTHVAGILAALDNSVGVVGGAPDVNLLPVRVLKASGSGSYSTIAAAILWAADKNGGNASVLSMSLGGASGNDVLEAALRTVESDAAYTHPVIVVAAGNDGTGALPSYPARYASYDPTRTDPDPVPGLLPVAALCDPGFVPSGTSSDRCATGVSGTVTEPYVIASFSSEPWIGVPTGGPSIPTGVSAPGTNVYSTVPGTTPQSYATSAVYAYLSGTSMATPFVAAVAALVVAHCGSLDSSGIVTRIETTAHDLGAAGPDVTYGYGRVDAVAAVTGC